MLIEITFDKILKENPENLVFEIGKKKVQIPKSKSFVDDDTLFFHGQEDWSRLFQDDNHRFYCCQQQL